MTFLEINLIGHGTRPKIKSFYNKQKFQNDGEEGFYMFLTIFEGADFEFTCYQACKPAVFLIFQK